MAPSLVTRLLFVALLAALVALLAPPVEASAGKIIMAGILPGGTRSQAFASASKGISLKPRISFKLGYIASRFKSFLPAAIMAVPTDGKTAGEGRRRRSFSNPLEPLRKRFVAYGRVQPEASINYYKSSTKFYSASSMDSFSPEWDSQWESP